MQQKKANVNYYFLNRLTFKIKTDLDATVDSHKNTGIIYSDDRVSKCGSSFLRSNSWSSDIVIQNVKEAEL